MSKKVLVFLAFMAHGDKEDQKILDGNMTTQQYKSIVRYRYPKAESSEWWHS